MEKLTSRKNPVIQHLRRLASDSGYRNEQGEYVLDGVKLLREAMAFGGRVGCVLWPGEPEFPVPGADIYTAPKDLVEYASPLKNSPGPVFTVAIPEEETKLPLENALVLENVQDPGNVGTVLRTAKALGVDAVVLLGACADVYSPKAARATMGAIFRQRLIHTDRKGLKTLAAENALPLYAAALSEQAVDIRSLPLGRAMVCVGSEGQGLSQELLAQCDGQLIIPMTPGSESLNAAVAASLIMWEMTRNTIER